MEKGGRSIRTTCAFASDLGTRPRTRRAVALCRSSSEFGRARAFKIAVLVRRPKLVFQTLIPAALQSAHLNFNLICNKDEPCRRRYNLP